MKWQGMHVSLLLVAQRKPQRLIRRMKSWKKLCLNSANPAVLLTHQAAYRPQYISISGRQLGWCPYGNDAKGGDILQVTPNRDLCRFGAEHEITKRFDEIINEEQKLNDRSKEIKATVWAALNSVTTLKRLVEVWPESKELIPENSDSVKSTLPALKVEDLNRMIGLPTEEAA